MPGLKTSATRLAPVATHLAEIAFIACLGFSARSASRRTRGSAYVDDVSDTRNGDGCHDEWISGTSNGWDRRLEGDSLGSFKHM
jgi:hypothetical protein